MTFDSLKNQFAYMFWPELLWYFEKTIERVTTLRDTNGILIDIYVDQESNEDHRESNIKKLLEEQLMFDKVKGLGHIHHATVDTVFIPKEVTDGLNDNPDNAEIKNDLPLGHALDVITIHIHETTGNVIDIAKHNDEDNLDSKAGDGTRSS